MYIVQKFKTLIHFSFCNFDMEIWLSTYAYNIWDWNYTITCLYASFLSKCLALRSSELNSQSSVWKKVCIYVHKYPNKSLMGGSIKYSSYLYCQAKMFVFLSNRTFGYLLSSHHGSPCGITTVSQVVKSFIHHHWGKAHRLSHRFNLWYNKCEQNKSESFMPITHLLNIIDKWSVPLSEQLSNNNPSGIASCWISWIKHRHSKHRELVYSVAPIVLKVGYVL